MEAVGSRLGRASSRYGGAATVFNGPVRKWKKKWVHVSSPSSTFHNSHSHNNNNSSSSNSNNGGSSLLLCRWTPITPQSTDDTDNSSGVNFSDEPPRRKFRYTPIAVLEEQKKVVNERPEYEPSTESDLLATRQTNVTREKHGKLNMNEISENEPQDSDISQLDLGLGFQGSNGENSQNSDDQWEKKNISTGWSMN